MATVRLTAYGLTAKASGFANSTNACRTAAGGTQLLANDDSAIFAFVQDGNVDRRVYLAKVSSPSAASDFYTLDDDTFEDNEVIFVPAQSLGGNFGTLTSSGYYTTTGDGHFDNAIYITILESTNQMTQPGDCEAVLWPNQESPPTGDQFNTKFVDNQMSQLVTQYKRGTGLESFVPARMTVRGPSNLRSRPQSLVYKVTKG